MVTAELRFAIIWILFAACFQQPADALVPCPCSCQPDLYWCEFFAHVVTSLNKIPYLYDIVKIREKSNSLLIFRKQLRSCENNIGEILEKLSNHAGRIEYGILFLPYIIVSPLQVIAIIILLLNKMVFLLKV